MAIFRLRNSPTQKLYSKLIELLVQSIIEPDQAMIMGGTYRIPILEGLLDEDFVEQLKTSGTFNDESFDREYKLHVLYKKGELLGSP